MKIGSIVKDFTAVVMLQLAEQGKLRLDDPIGNYLNDFSLEVLEKVTIRHLLRHEAGFGDHLMIPGSLEKLDALKTVQDIINYFKNEPLLFAPGTAEQNSNSGYAVLGTIIEHLTGKSYARAVGEMILQPLGMKDTFFDRQTIAVLPERTNITCNPPPESTVRCHFTNGPHRPAGPIPR